MTVADAGNTEIPARAIDLIIRSSENRTSFLIGKFRSPIKPLATILSDYTQNKLGQCSSKMLKTIIRIILLAAAGAAGFALAPSSRAQVTPQAQVVWGASVDRNGVAIARVCDLTGRRPRVTRHLRPDALPDSG